MKRISFAFLLVALCWSHIAGQTYRQYMKAAEQAVTSKNYFAAMKYFQEAIAIDGEKPEVLYKYAEAARLFASFTYADTAYSKVLAFDNADVYPLAPYWLANVKKKQGKYEDSRALYRQFISKVNDAVADEYYRNALREIDALEWVIEAIKSTDPNISFERLSNNINSPYSEFGALKKGDDLYFSTENFQRFWKKGYPPRQYSRVMISKNNGSNPVPAPFNDESKQTANVAFNKTGTRLYYTICDYVGETAIVNCNIYYRNIGENGIYSPPVKLPESINTPGYTSTQPALGYMEETRKEWLFFVSDRPGGQGGLDIWTSEISESGDFSKPVNLFELNTPGNDVTPFYHNQRKTLFFSADQRQGFGGFDIYRNRRVEGKWTKTEHLPAPFNSSYNDTHFWVNSGETQGFVTSSRLGSHVLEPEFEACCNDLYQFKVQVIDLAIYTYSKRDESPLNEANIELIEISSDGSRLSTVVSNPNSNEYMFQLKKGKKYILNASKPNFYPLTDTIDLTTGWNDDITKLERKLYLIPVAVMLKVLSYNEKTMNPLKGVEVRLVVDGQEVDFKNNKEENSVEFELERGKLYELIGAKVAYFSDTSRIDLRNDFNTSIINQILNLRPKEIEDFPPLVIYFDNDHPDPRTRNRTTALSYESTWQPYMQRRDIFRQEYVKSLIGQDSFNAVRRIEAFFDREVNNGFEALLRFSENTLEILQEGGFKVELIIQGFASPRAGADYNYDLSQRRADCLKNHFETWNDGALMPFIKRGLLTMDVVGYGEKLAPQYISDRLDDERESIYSVVASSERKVAIIGARRVSGN